MKAFVTYVSAGNLHRNRFSSPTTQNSEVKPKDVLFKHVVKATHLSLSKMISK